MNTLFNLLQPELEIVRQRLKEEITIRGRMVPGFSWPVLNQLDQDFLPALVLLSSRAQGYFGSRAIYLAAVLQFIFLASLTHNDIKQQAAPRILTGDYFYTCFFNLLCRDKNMEFLVPLSKLICDINLDAVRRLGKNAEESDNPVDSSCPKKFNGREYLAAAATYLGSQLGQTGRREAMIWQELGQSLGKLWNGQTETVRAIQTVERLVPDSIKDILEELVLQLNVKQPFKRVIAL